MNYMVQLMSIFPPMSFMLVFIFLNVHRCGRTISNNWFHSANMYWRTSNVRNVITNIIIRDLFSVSRIEVVRESSLYWPISGLGTRR